MFQAWKRVPASAALPLVGGALPLVGTAVSRVGSPKSVAAGLERTSLAGPRRRLAGRGGEASTPRGGRFGSTSPDWAGETAAAPTASTAARRLPPTAVRPPPHPRPTTVPPQPCLGFPNPPPPRGGGGEGSTKLVAGFLSSPAPSAPSRCRRNPPPPSLPRVLRVGPGRPTTAVRACCRPRTPPCGAWLPPADPRRVPRCVPAAELFARLREHARSGAEGGEEGEACGSGWHAARLPHATVTAALRSPARVGGGVRRAAVELQLVGAPPSPSWWGQVGFVHRPAGEPHAA